MHESSLVVHSSINIYTYVFILDQYDKEVLQNVDFLPSGNPKHEGDHSKGEMMNRTRTRLTEFYQGFNDKLAELLNDTRYRWL